MYRAKNKYSIESAVRESKTPAGSSTSEFLSRYLSSNDDVADGNRCRVQSSQTSESAEGIRRYGGQPVRAELAKEAQISVGAMRKSAMLTLTVR